MQGGNKGLLENSTNLCTSPHHATADFTGHNGKVANFKPLLAVSCHKHGKKKVSGTVTAAIRSGLRSGSIALATTSIVSSRSSAPRPFGARNDLVR